VQGLLLIALLLHHPATATRKSIACLFLASSTTNFTPCATNPPYQGLVYILPVYNARLLCIGMIHCWHYCSRAYRRGSNSWHSQQVTALCVNAWGVLTGVLHVCFRL